jgi:tetratricopeptide (TPR) repeat protein
LSSGLDNIQQLITKGSYFEAENLLEEILSEKSTPPQEKILAKILLAFISNRLGIFEDRTHRLNNSISLLNKTIKEIEKVDNPILLFDAYQIQLLNFYQHSNPDELQKLYKKYLDLLNRIQKENKTKFKQAQNFTLLSKACSKYFQAYMDPKAESDLLRQGNALVNTVFENAKDLKHHELMLLATYVLYDYIKLIHLDQLLKLYQDAIKVADKIPNNFWKAELLYLKGRIYLNKGDFDRHLEFTEKAIELDEKNGNEFSKVTRYWSLGTNFTAKYDDANALKYYLKALSLNEATNNTPAVRACYRFAGVAYERMGQLDKALEYYQKSHNLFKKAVPVSLSLMQGNIASIYVRKGELEKGLALYEELLDFYTNKVEDKHTQAYLMAYIMEIYWYRGELAKAIEFAQMSIEISNEIGRKDVSKMLYSLVLLTKEAGQIELANKYLAQRKELIEELKIKPRRRENEFLEAYLLKESENPRDWVRAELIFEKLLGRKIPYFLRVDVLINFCELLIKEASAQNDATALEKADNYLKELHKLAVSNEIPYLTVESLWLQSKLALLNLDIGNANLLISRALNIATKKGLERLKKKLLEEQAGINEIISQLVNMSKSPDAVSDIKERLNVIGMKETLDEVKKQRILNLREEESIITKKLFSLKL